MKNYCPAQLFTIVNDSERKSFQEENERKLKEAGHSLDEKNKVNINLNPDKNEIISKGQGALILK